MSNYTWRQLKVTYIKFPAECAHCGNRFGNRRRAIKDSFEKPSWFRNYYETRQYRVDVPVCSDCYELLEDKRKEYKRSLIKRGAVNYLFFVISFALIHILFYLRELREWQGIFEDNIHIDWYYIWSSVQYGYPFLLVLLGIFTVLQLAFLGPEYARACSDNGLFFAEFNADGKLRFMNKEYQHRFDELNPENTSP
jgi:hypothetical protein